MEDRHHESFPSSSTNNLLGILLRGSDDDDNSSAKSFGPKSFEKPFEDHRLEPDPFREPITSPKLITTAPNFEDRLHLSVLSSAHPDVTNQRHNDDHGQNEDELLGSNGFLPGQLPSGHFDNINIEQLIIGSNSDESGTISSWTDDQKSNDFVDPEDRNNMIFDILDPTDIFTSGLNDKTSSNFAHNQGLFGNMHQDPAGAEERRGRFRPYQEQKWMAFFDGLLEFKRKFGHCCVPYSYSDTALARWVKRQRHQYKKLRANDPTSTLTPSRMERLEAVGFVWHSHAAAWMEKLNELREFKDQRGHCNVPSQFPENPPLSTWVKCQRRQFKLYKSGESSTLTRVRFSLLKNLGFVFEPQLGRIASKDSKDLGAC